MPPPRHGRKRGGPPPWWPEGEAWPPHGPPWRMAPRRFRRRLLLVAIGLVATFVTVGVVIGVATSGHGGPWWQGGGPRRGPWALFGFAGFLALVGGLATARAYRRIGEPVAKLLTAAGRLAEGDYTVKVDPRGPHDLRALTTTFNDMAGRLAASDEQRRRFLADVTHELRTPLAVLQSGIEAQLDGVHPRDDRHLASLLEETQLLARLVEDLHTLALAGAGRLTLHHERTHPAALVEEAVESHAALAQRRGSSILATVPEGLPELDVDPTRIRQVLANLLSNAVRHSPPGRAVTVRVGTDPAGVRFTVADSGPGIPADELAHLFERFTRSADSPGSGLGLAIARDLVHAHGGTIEASNRPDGGASVTFTVPIERPPSR
jgi:signal transduction histidine kinase